MCSRHWFFGAKIIMDGQEMPHSLFQLVKAPLKANPRNSVIGFHDNSSAIRHALCSCQHACGLALDVGVLARCKGLAARHEGAAAIKHAFWAGR